MFLQGSAFPSEFQASCGLVQDPALTKLRQAAEAGTLTVHIPDTFGKVTPDTSTEVGFSPFNALSQ